MITTDKVYDNKEWHYPYRENDRLGGYDPYSASKACAEIVIDSFRNSFFNSNNFSNHQKAIASVRAGNVIGGGDWSEDRLLPDIAKYIATNKAVIVRSPNSVRPWQHVLEPVFGYLQLGIALSENPLKYTGAWNFGPSNDDNLPVINIVKKAIEIWGKGTLELQINANAVHEAKLLKLDISKVVNELGWKPKTNMSIAIEKTINWYKAYYEENLPAAKLVESDILFFQSLF
jgi:CDP-glucose 4,6-dehydratase